TVAADLVSSEAALKAIETVERQLGPIDVLVTSAGAAKRTPPDELTPLAWHAAMDAKYFSYVHVIDPVVKRMGGRGRGVIVTVFAASARASYLTGVVITMDGASSPIVV